MLRYSVKLSLASSLGNARKHVDVQLVTKWEGRYGAEALISKPNFYSCAIFSKDIVPVELKKTEILFNKPTYLGLSVLYIFKAVMYDFHYSYMLPKYGSMLKMVYTDTDIFIHEVKF